MKTWLVMWNLLLRRPLVTILLCLLYLTAALLFVALEPAKRGAAAGAMSAFAAGGLTALVTEQIARYSLAAGSLGVPEHARVMRRTQALFLILFVAAPGAGACLLGQAPLPTAAVLLGAAAVGVALSMYGLWWLMLLPALGRFPTLWHWLTFPVSQVMTLAASAWLLWRWLDLSRKRERIGQAAPARLSDSRHERAAGIVRPAAPTGSAPPAPAHRDTPIPLLLATGLGYSVRTDWRHALYGAVAGLTALVLWHAIRGTSADAMSYVAVSAVCCFTLVGRLQNILDRWMRTPAEQGILRVAPFWPETRAIKRAILECTFQVQRGAAAAWAALSAVAWSLHLITGAWLFHAAVALAGTSLAFSASMWATLARRRIREWHLSTILIVITVGCGAVITAFGSMLTGHHLALGIAVMLAPPAAALSWYLLAPLRVPVTVDARALRLSN